MQEHPASVAVGTHPKVRLLAHPTARPVLPLWVGRQRAWSERLQDPLPCCAVLLLVRVRVRVRVGVRVRVRVRVRVGVRVRVRVRVAPPDPSEAAPPSSKGLDLYPLGEELE